MEQGRKKSALESNVAKNRKGEGGGNGGRREGVIERGGRREEEGEEGGREQWKGKKGRTEGQRVPARE